MEVIAKKATCIYLSSTRPLDGGGGIIKFSIQHHNISNLLITPTPPLDRGGTPQNLLSNVTHNYLSPTPPPLDKGNIVKFVVQHHTRVIYHQHDPSMEATTLTSLLDITRERTPTNKQHDSSKEVTSSNPLINAANEHLSPVQLLDGGEPQGQSLLFSMTHSSTHNIRAPKTIKPRNPWKEATSSIYQNEKKLPGT